MSRRPSVPHRNDRRKLRCRRRLQLERVEERLLLAVITVNTGADTTSATTLTLRQAIEIVDGTLAISSLTSQQQALINGSLNTPPTPNTIAFAIAGAGVQTIAPLTPLPAITAPVIIDGTTQPGYMGTPIIAIDGSNAGRAANGLQINVGAVRSTIHALDIVNFSSGVGIEINQAANNTIIGDYLGVDASGTVSKGNLDGLEILNSSGNTVGGTTTAARNVISGNGNTTTMVGDGVLISGNSSTGNVVEGNDIGTSLTGIAAVPNGANGVEIASGASTNTVGGTAAGSANLICFNAVNGVLITTSGNLVEDDTITLNGNDGVKITGTGVTDNLVVANQIGTDATGTKPEGNLANGVEIAAGALFNTIGGTAAGAGNIISSNGTTTALGDGVLITGAGTTTNLVEGNHIGTDPTGTLALPNAANGVEIASGANGNTVGGTTAAAANVIANNAVNGVLITTSSNLVAGNTIVLNSNDGVLITTTGTTANLVEGNFIGTDSTGTKVEGNKANGVEIATAANTNTVGGTTAAAANLIANNTVNGVLITTNGNLVAGNTILSNGTNGVDLRAGASTNTLGGTAAGAGNTIALNGNDGVLITAAGTTANLVEGNFIGTDSTGTKVEGNKANGVEIATAANTNTVGGTTAGAGNLIANNAVNGVLVTTNGNLVAGNTILSNGTNGVELAAGASTNTIGGTAAGAGNTIALNGNDGVLITAAGTAANLVEGNFIGTDSTGTTIEGNKANGVEIATAANTNTVGGTTAAAGNLIANNTVNGVLITTSSNLVAGNTILSNGTNGVEIAAGASTNTLGGTAAGAGNTIALNGNDGVLITAAGTAANLVQGNFIGTDSTGTKVEGNKANGVEIATAANTNTVGGTTAAAGNLIANDTVNGVLITTSSNLVAGNTIVLNSNDGVLITAAGTTANLVQGNFIGTDSTGTKVEGNKANGVEIATAANTNTVGGTAAHAANLIANNTLNGVLITSSSNLVAGNTIVLNSNDGVLITAAGTTANLVEGNFIGTDSTGTKVEGNKANGVEIATAANTNTVGGTAAAAANLIANNTLNGVLITSSSNLVAGNTILSNGTNGVEIAAGASTNTIGGTAAGAGNTIALNGNDGVLISATSATANLVEGNFIGTDSTGTKVEGNKANGVEIATAANTNTVGGTTAAAANLIANNTLNGVLITTSGNLVAGNTIVLNGNDGVLITAAGTTANLVEGNFIGTDSTGTKVEGNKANGVEIASAANTNTVGGTTASRRQPDCQQHAQWCFDHQQQQPGRRQHDPQQRDQRRRDRRRGEHQHDRRNRCRRRQHDRAQRQRRRADHRHRYHRQPGPG